MTIDTVFKELAGLEKDVALLRRVLKQSRIKIPGIIDQGLPLILDALTPPKAVFPQSGSDKAARLPGFFGLFGDRGHDGSGRSGTPSVNVNVINNTGSSVNVSERDNGRGGIDIDIMIDQMMAQSLSRPGSQTGRLLHSLFGLSPLLSRR